MNIPPLPGIPEENPELGIPEMPELPDPPRPIILQQPVTIGQLLIAFLLVAILMTLVLYFVEKPEFTVMCHTKANLTMETLDYAKTNNIQAPHVQFDYATTITLLEKAGIIHDYGFLQGASMNPTFYDGNMALAINITNQTILKPGQLIRYYTEPTPSCNITKTDNIPYVIHRIVAVYNDDKIITAGDNNLASEEIKRCQITNIIIGILYT